MSSNQPPPMAPQGQPQQQGLPPTGLQQQLTSLNSLYGAAQGAGGGIGFDPRQQQFAAVQAGGGGNLSVGQQMGSSSMDQMVRNLAQRYGMPIGRGRLVDDQGNLMLNAEQLAGSSGGQMTMGEAAANMNYLEQAMASYSRQQQQQKSVAAIQTGLGQVQSRARGSMAAMTSGLYQNLSQIYSDPNASYQAKDYSFYIQKEKQMIESDLLRRAEKLAKKQARGQFIGGIGLTIAGLFTGQYGAAAQGAQMAGSSAGSTGWF